MTGFDRAAECLWDAEYRSGATLPTTTRRTPSRLFGLLGDLLPQWRGGRILDAGCGIGRNALYLANLGYTVFGVDVSRVALDQLRGQAERVRHGRVSCLQASLASPWPFLAGSFAAVLDFYVSCHVTAPAQARAYRREAARVLDVGGMLVSAVFAPDDGYYGTMSVVPCPGVVVDRANGIGTRLYTEDELRTPADDGLDLERLVSHRFTDRVGTRDFPRSIVVSILRKRDR